MSSVSNKLKLRDVAVVKSGYSFRKTIRHTGGPAGVIHLRDIDQEQIVNWDCIVYTDLQRKAPNWLQDDDIIVNARGNSIFAIHLRKVPVFVPARTHNSPCSHLSKIFSSN